MTIKPHLSPREQEVLELILGRLDIATIAKRMRITVGSAKNYRHSLVRKFGVRGAEQLRCLIAARERFSVVAR